MLMKITPFFEIENKADASLVPMSTKLYYSVTRNFVFKPVGIYFILQSHMILRLDFKLAIESKTYANLVSTGKTG